MTRIFSTTALRRGGPVALVVALAGCGTPAKAFDPGKLGARDGALFGHFTVLAGSADATSSCYVEIADQHQQRLSYISLDKSGWLFASVRPGPAYISSVLCPRIQGNLGVPLFRYPPRGVINVPATPRIAYFGHVQLNFTEGSEPRGSLELEITARFPEAKHALQTLYPATRLTPIESLLPLVNPLEAD